MPTRPHLVDLDALISSEEAAVKREYIRAIALNAVLKTIRLRNRQLFTIRDAGLAQAIFTLLDDVREDDAEERSNVEIAPTSQPRGPEIQVAVDAVASQLDIDPSWRATQGE